MNEPWVIEKLREVPGPDEYVPYDPASPTKTFKFGYDSDGLYVLI